MGAFVNNNLYPDAFYQGFDGNLWSFGNNGTAWSFANHSTPPGVSITDYVGKVVKDNTNPIIFVKGSDGNLWREAYAGGSTWNWGNNGTPSGVSIAAPMGAVNNNTSYPLAFILGSDGNLWHDGYNGSTWNWANHGTPTGVQLKASMGVVSNNGNTPMVFVLGSDGNLWRNVNVGSGWTWANMGIPAAGVSIVSSMGAIVNNGSYPIVFVLGSDGNLWRDGYNGSTWTWANMGSPNALGITGSMGAVVNNHAYPEVFVTGGDGNLWRNAWNGTTWNWFNLGTPSTTGIGASLGAVVNNSIYPIVFVMGDDSNLWTCAWNGSTWTWTNQSNLVVTPGTLNLKYQILNVEYAPPGHHSYASYSNTTTLGLSTDNSATFSKGKTVTTTLTYGSPQQGNVLSGSHSYTQQMGSSETILLNESESDSYQVNGPQSSSVGIDHDADVIWLWLNPQVKFTVTGPNSVRWNGYGNNTADPAYQGKMDEFPVTVNDLKSYILGLKPMPSPLLRAWDSAGLGALTSGDLINILAADPLASLYGIASTFNPNTDNSGRYDIQSGYLFYTPGTQVTQPNPTTYSVQAQNTTLRGQSGMYQYSVGYTVGDSGTDSSFGADMASMSSSANTYVVTDSWNRTLIQGSSATATVVVTGPTYADNYTGPQQIQVWRDNVYGSFMFFYAP